MGALELVLSIRCSMYEHITKMIRCEKLSFMYNCGEQGWGLLIKLRLGLGLPVRIIYHGCNISNFQLANIVLQG